jgi:hypothetical protein
MESSRERVISISLTEQEWQAFVRLHPQPVNWLRERIQESLGPRTGQGPGVDAAISAPSSTSAAVNTTSASIR